MLTDIFKTSILAADINLDLTEIKKLCLDFQQNDEGRRVSNRGGFQSSGAMDIESGPLKPLYEKIHSAVKDYAAEIGLPSDSRLQFDETWININEYKDYNMYHAHPGCLIAGVFYVQAPIDCGDIRFFRPGSAEIMSYWPTHRMDKYTPQSSADYVLPAKEGRLYLFPAFLHHQVEPMLNKTEKRISISFNVG